MSSTPTKRKYPLIQVPQWLPGWEEIQFNPEQFRKRPPDAFFVTAIPAGLLKALSGVERRKTENRALGQGQDLGVQRALDENRSEEISRFVEYGYPWSDLSPAKRRSEEFHDLKMPGWLPTAIVINIKKEGDIRNNFQVDKDDLVGVLNEGSTFDLELPASLTELPWKPKASHPIEVIDGQHRLWAFEDNDIHENFYLPVVVFHGLDISWQAYLFYVINIKPKRINSSLAYDLYPLLRNEDWLEKIEGHLIYRETRAQELTQILWSYPSSPWRNRINMLGESGRGHVRQASWVRNLTATLIRRLSPNATRGGLFGSTSGGVLSWTRTAQASFLIYFWQLIQKEVENVELPWAVALREQQQEGIDEDAAFSGDLTLLNTDQGVRGVLSVLNDICIEGRDALNLESWNVSSPSDEPSNEEINAAIASLILNNVMRTFLEKLAAGIATFDWRTSNAPGLTDPEKTIRLTFRGSSGYGQVKRRLLEHLSGLNDDIGDIAVIADRILRSES